MFGKKKKAEKPKKSTKKELTERDIAEKIEDGELRVIVTFEVVGKPKKHVEDSLKEYLKNIKKDARLSVIHEESAEAIETDGMWSTFSEVEMLVNELSTLVWLCVNFSPAAIEIQEPGSKVVSAAEMSMWVNDLLSKLHAASHEYRDTKQKNLKLVEALNALIQNGIITSLEAGPATALEIQKKLGIHQDQLKPFFEHLVKRERIKKKGERYMV